MGSKRITSTLQADNCDCDGGDKKQNKQRRKSPQPYQLMIEVVMIGIKKNTSALLADDRGGDDSDNKKTTSALRAGNRGAQVLQLPSSLVDATWLVGFETTP